MSYIVGLSAPKNMHQKSLLPGGTEQQTEKKEKHIEQVKYTTCRKEKQ